MVLFTSRIRSAFWVALLSAEGLAGAGRFPALLTLQQSTPDPGREPPRRRRIQVAQVSGTEQLGGQLQRLRAQGCTDFLIVVPAARLDEFHDLVGQADLVVSTQAASAERPANQTRACALGGERKRSARSEPRSCRDDPGAPVLPVRVPTFDALSRAALLAGRPSPSLGRRAHMLASAIVAASAFEMSDVAERMAAPPPPCDAGGQAETAACVTTPAARLRRRARRSWPPPQSTRQSGARTLGRTRPRALSPPSCRTRLDPTVHDLLAFVGSVRRR